MDLKAYQLTHLRGSILDPGLTSFLANGKIQSAEITFNDSFANFEELQIALRQKFDDIDKIALGFKRGLDEGWILLSGIGIFGMQLGFAMIESGTVESKSVKSTLMKNIADAIFGGITWYLFGFGMFTGDGPFVGTVSSTNKNFLPADADVFPYFFQQYGFSITSATIVSGSILGRIRFESYLAFAVIFTSYVYPIVAHWVWTPSGWLAQLGFVDFSGSMAIHGLGGISAFVGAWMCGPRVGRFYPLAKGQKRPLVRPLKCNSVVLVNLGGSILYIDWFYFNSGSSLGVSNEASLAAASQATVTTLISSVFACGLVILYEIFWTTTKEVETVVNGLLAGLVGITAGCAAVSSFDAMILGIIFGGWYLFCSWFILHILLIDDPLDASAIHMGCGVLGTFLIGFFSVNGGIFHGHNAELLKIQVIGIAAIGAWAVFNATLLFFLIGKSIGLTVSKEEQMVGLDLVNHEAAVNELDTIQIQEFALRKDMENRLAQKRKREREGSEKSPSSGGLVLTALKNVFKNSKGSSKVGNSTGNKK